MKNCRKLLSIILVLAMVMQILPVFATEASEATPAPGISYLLYDEFGNNDTNGWTELTTGNETNTVGTEEISDGSGNYALTYSSVDDAGSQNAVLTKALTTPAQFSGDKDVVIETKFKQTGSGSSYLKFNTTNPNYYERYCGWGMLFRRTGTATRVSSGWVKNSNNLYWNYKGGWWDGLTDNSIATAVDTWYTYKIIISGGEIDTETHKAIGNTATYYIYDESGNEVANKTFSIDFPNDSSWGSSTAELNNVNWVEDALNSLSFRLGDSATTISIDYVKVYEIYKDVEISADTSYAENEAVKVSFNVPADGLKNAVALYDAQGNQVRTTNSLDESKTSVILTPENKLVSGNKYTVKVISTLVPENYIFTKTEKQFVVSNTEYLLYDEFGADDKNGWVAKNGSSEDATAVSTALVDGSTDNYMLTYSVSTGFDSKYLTRALDDPAEISADKDIVIETKFKRTGTGSVYLKHNVKNANYYEHKSGWGMLLRKTEGSVRVLNGWEATNDVYFYYKGGWWDDNNDNKLSLSPTNVWYTYKVVIHGGEINNETHNATGNTADFYIYDENGNEVAKKLNSNIDFPNNSNWGQSGTADPSTTNISWVEDAINSLAFRLGDSQTTVNIDYVKVYEAEDLSFTVGNHYRKNEEVKVTFDAENGNAALADAVVLYDADGEIVATTNTIDEAGKIVTLVHNGLVNNQAYTVKLDATKVPDNYNVKTTEVTFTVGDVKYYLNDEFGADDKNDWIAKNGSSEDTTAVSTALVDGSTDNYMLTYSVSTGFDSKYLTRALDAPAEISADKDIVIETKMKQTGTGSAYLKYNVKNPNYYEHKSGWGMLVRKTEGTVRVLNGWEATNDVYFYYKGGWWDGNNDNKLSLSSADEWYTYKVVIHGGNINKETHNATGNTADFYIYDENGNEVAKKLNSNIDFPNNSNWGQSGTADPSTTNISWVEDAINSLAFRLGDSETTVNIDYVKVYEAEDLSFTAGGHYYGVNDEIKVTFDVENGNDELANAVVLYDADGEVVATTNTIDETGKVVTLAHSGLTNNSTYTVKLNLTKMPDGYIVKTTEDKFTVADVRYYLNDEFGADDKNGWVAKNGSSEDATAVSTALVDGSTDNYMLTYSASTGFDSKYLTKALDTPAEFSKDRDIVIETKIKNTGSGSVYLKYNLNNPGYYERYCGWGMLFRKVGTSARVSSGWAATNNVYYTYKGIGWDGFDDNRISFDTADAWYTYKIVIHGGTINSETHTAEGNIATYYIYDENEAVIANKTFSIDFPNNSSWGANGNAEFGNVNWVEDAINSVAFRLADAETTVNIDYVKVYDQNRMDIKAQLSGGRYVQYNQPLSVEILTDKEISASDGAVIAESITIDGVDTTASFDTATKTVSVTPADGFTKGTQYIVRVDAENLKAANITYSGTTVWTIWARNERQTGEVISDSFDKDNGTFIRGAANAGKEGKVNYTTYKGEDVLELISAELNDNPGNQSNIFSDLNGGIAFDSAKDIVIKTRFAHTNTSSRVYLKLNRTNMTSQPDLDLMGNYNTLLCIDGRTSFFPDGIAGDSNVELGLTLNNTHKFEAGEWVEAEIVIHGIGGGVSVTTSYTDENNNVIEKTSEGSIINPSALYDFYYGKGTDKKGYEALESLTFTFRANTAGITDTLYVDYLDVYTRDIVPAAVNFYGENKVATDTITDGMNVIPVYDFYDASEKEYTAISAMYKDGKLVDMSFTPVTSGADLRFEGEGYEIEDATNVVVKAFVWDSIDTMIPAGNTAVIKGDMQEDTLRIYVDAKATDGTGEQGSPVAGIAQALELAKNVDQQKAVEIIVGEGNYFIDETITVNNENHVTDKLTIKAADGETPVLINGETISLASAVPAADTIKNRLADQTKRDNLYQIQLPQDMVIPAVSLPGEYSYKADGVQTSTGVLDITEPNVATSEIFYNGKPLTIARYPNEGYSTIDNLIQAGSATTGWVDGSVAVADRVVTPFKMLVDRAEKWSQATDALMFGFWKWDWAAQTVPVTFEGITVTSKYPTYHGVKDGQRYYTFNLLEEIDAPGEYYIDRVNKILYFYLPQGATAGEGSTDEFIISTGNERMFMLEANHTVLDGLKFVASREHPIQIMGGGNVVKNCEFSGMANDTIHIYGESNRVENCNIHDVNGGIFVLAGESADFTPGSNIITNNTITNYSRIDKLHTYAICLKGSGNTASYNDISHGEHSAIHFTGTNHSIINNDIWDVCKEVDDAGVIYVGGSWVVRGNKIHNNFIHDIVRDKAIAANAGISGIYLDDHFAGADIKGNVFADIEGYGVMSNKGRENVISNNIFVNCSTSAVGMSSLENPDANKYTDYVSEVAGYLGNALWKSKYPKLFTADGTAVNTNELIYSNYNEITNNLAYNCGNGFFVQSYATQQGNVISNNPTPSTDPGFANYAGKNYAIDASNTGIDGFEAIPFGSFGRN